MLRLQPKRVGLGGRQWWTAPTSSPGSRGRDHAAALPQSPRWHAARPSSPNLNRLADLAVDGEGRRTFVILASWHHDAKAPSATYIRSAPTSKRAETTFGASCPPATSRFPRLARRGFGEDGAGGACQESTTTSPSTVARSRTPMSPACGRSYSRCRARHGERFVLPDAQPSVKRTRLRVRDLRSTLPAPSIARLQAV